MKASPTQYHKRDFWSEENLKYSQAHYRLRKSARIINRLARGRECSLLDVGCGPATLGALLSPGIEYFGVDIAIQSPGPNLREVDFLDKAIEFAGRKFDFVVVQGVFEYVGSYEEQKLAEIAELLSDGGLLIVSYVNFDHRAREIYWPYNNVRPFDDFYASLASQFKVRRFIPTSHNWRHGEPEKSFVRNLNMYININVPIISRTLAVEYFFICSART